jgi:hypothetical protein
MVRFCSPKHFGQHWPCTNCSSVQFQNTGLTYRPPVLFMSTYDCHQKYSYSLSFDKFNQRCIYMSDFMVGFCSPMRFGQDWPCSNTWIFLFNHFNFEKAARCEIALLKIRHVFTILWQVQSKMYLHVQFHGPILQSDAFWTWLTVLKLLISTISILTISIFNRPRNLKSRYWKSDV